MNLKQKISAVYTITNNIDNKVYVGYSSNIEKRFKEHKYAINNNSHGNQHLQFAINKFGLDNFKFEILEEYNKELLSAMEHYWCNLLNSHNENYGYNIQITDPNGKFKLSEESRKKLSNSLKGRIFSEEWKNKLSKSRKGIKLSESHIQAIKSSNIGNKHSLGFKQTEITKNKRSKSLNKEIYQYDLNMTFIKKWDCSKDASKQLDISVDSIRQCARNSKKTGGNFIWKYAIKELSTKVKALENK